MRHRWVHSVSVASRTHAMLGNEPSSSLPANVTCLIEPSASVDFRTGAESTSQRTHYMTWGDEAIRAGMVVTWNGVKFEVLKVISDGSRPFSTLPNYQAAWLKEIY